MAIIKINYVNKNSKSFNFSQHLQIDNKITLEE